VAYAVKLYSGCESLAMVLPVLFVAQFLMIHFFTGSIMTRRRENKLEQRSFMDRTYKEDIPSARRALEELKKEFSGVASTTDWTKLRIEPLLDHVKSLERLLRSPKFARETARLRRGVVMFHSDLVYLRENVRALKEILEVERRSHRRRAASGAGRSAYSR
jgi:hypothetical protein